MDRAVRSLRAESDQRLQRAFRVVRTGKMDGGIAWRTQQAANAAANAVPRFRQRFVIAERPLSDGRHALCARKDDGYRIAVRCRQVSQILHVTADKIIVRLREQNVNSLIAHRCADCGPASFEFDR